MAGTPVKLTLNDKYQISLIRPGAKKPRSSFRIIGAFD